MIDKVFLVGFEGVDGAFKTWFKDGKGLLLSFFFLSISSSRFTNVFFQLLEHSFDSSNRGIFHEHVNIRGSHLSKHSNNGNISRSETNLYTGFKKNWWLVGEFKKGDILGRKFIKKAQSTVKGTLGTSMISNSLDEKSGLIFSDHSGSLESSFIISKVLSGGGKISFSQHFGVFT